VTPDLRQRLRVSITGHEGLVLRAYDDATGRVVHPGTAVGGWVSIGYGRNLVGRGITKPEAEHLLDNDFAIVEADLDQHFPAWRTWSEPRQWAVFELGYNMGVGRFAATWPNTAAALRAGQFEAVAATLAGSKWRRQVGDGRALAVIRAMHGGTWT
jgi:lysozyme